MKVNIDPRTGRPILPIDEIIENEDLANSAPDSTRDNSKRPDTWKPPLITYDEHRENNPYSH